MARQTACPMPAPASSRRRRAVIIGGSMSGLFAAAFLRRIGWDVDVYERSKVQLVGSGAGMTNVGVEVDKRVALDRAGRVIAEKRLPQILTSWDRLQRLMRETIEETRYHLGHTFERVEQDGSQVVVHFAGGQRERADLLVGGDGIRSSVRARVAPAVAPIYAGYFLSRGAPNE